MLCVCEIFCSFLFNYIASTYSIGRVLCRLLSTALNFKSPSNTVRYIELYCVEGIKWTRTKERNESATRIVALCWRRLTISFVRLISLVLMNRSRIGDSLFNVSHHRHKYETGTMCNSNDSRKKRNDEEKNWETETEFVFCSIYFVFIVMHSTGRQMGLKYENWPAIQTSCIVSSTYYIYSCFCSFHLFVVF